jgi:glycosyltransferase involved in cell wall biosynthesis
MNLGRVAPPALRLPARLTKMTAKATPRVLFLTGHCPWPPVSGGRRRELELLERCSERFDVHLVAVSKTPAEDRAGAARLAGRLSRVEVFAAAGRPHGASCSLPPAAPQVLRHHCPAATRRVAELIASGAVDLVHVEGFYLMAHLPAGGRPPTLLAEQNVEYQLADQRLAVAGDLVARVQALRTRRAELAAWRRADALAAVSAEDRETIAAAQPARRVTLVPDGADHVPLADAGARRAASSPPRALLLGNFAYAPNVDAALHLAAEIMPRLRALAGEVELVLAGNDPPAAVRALAGPGVRVTGRVADVVSHLDAAEVVLCPLRIGGGVKVKTIEALRRGKAIVSTRVGAQGLGHEARAALEIADQPERFAAAAAALLRDPVRRAERERLALRAGAALPSWDQAADALAGAYEELLARPLAAAGAIRAR